MKTIWLAACAACVLSATASAQMNAGGTTQPTMTPQPMPAQMAMASNGPLTRAQVRADLARARADGTIPRFGNPDPYGPARSSRNAPSMYPGR
ncbi:hypothetical protein AWB71_04397 [Caballeronia peredens]|nr:hypothetical protein AWB71_04397 [Caballeronia peredens]